VGFSKRRDYLQQSRLPKLAPDICGVDCVCPRTYCSMGPAAGLRGMFTVAGREGVLVGRFLAVMPRKIQGHGGSCNNTQVRCEYFLN
jgi:hypothetical protein